MPNLKQVADWAEIIGLIGIPLTIFGFWLAYRSRRIHRLICEFDPVTSPLEIKAGEALEGEIEIRYKGQPVESIFIVNAKLENAGNESIRESEVVKPVTFSFGTNAKLIRQPKILHRKPPNLGARWTATGESSATNVVQLATGPFRADQAVLSFDLLNPGDHLTTEFLCTGEPGFPEPTARIEGIREIEVRATDEERAHQRMWLSLLAFTTLVSWLGGIDSYLHSRPSATLRVAIFWVASSLVFFGLWLRRKLS